MSTQYAVLPVTEPAWTGPGPCQGCGGLGVTGERYQMPGTDPVLLADVICPQCGGCGNGDPEHRYCKPIAHVADSADDLGAWGEDDDGPGQEPACPSCYGRRWNAVTGFTAGGAVGEDEELAVLRVPCGCAAPLLETGPDPAALAPYPHVFNLPGGIWPDA